MKEYADDNCEFKENGGKLSKRVENIVGKGEIAVMSNFSFFHSVFQRLQQTGKQKLARERVNQLPDKKILDWSKSKQIADDILKCILKIKVSAI